MSLLTNVPIQNVIKRRRIPNAFMLFVKENRTKVIQNQPGENLTVIGAILGKKWKSLGPEEKQVYYDQYKALKEKYDDASENVMDKDLIHDIDEITRDMPKLTTPEDASDAYNVREGPSDSKKHKTRAPKSSEGDCILPADSTLMKKVTRRGKNPFLIFASEQKNNVKSTPKNHKSTILGNMWQNLDYSEKKKYVERAKIESLLDADVTQGPSASVSKSKKQKSNKKAVRKLLARKHRKGTERTLPKKNEARSNMENTVDPGASGSSSVVHENPNVGNASDSAACHHASQPCSSASCTWLPTSSSCFTTASASQCQAHSGALSEPLSVFGQVSSALHSREPSYRGNGTASNNFLQPLCLHSAPDGLVPNQAHYGGLYRPYFSGMPGIYPPDPLSYFWIYQQSMFSHQPLSAIYQSHCPCSNPYAAYPGNHFRSFIYGQSGSSYPSATPTSFSQPAQASTTVHRDDVAQNPTRQCYNEREASDNENNLVIVDDELDERGVDEESPR